MTIKQEKKELKEKLDTLKMQLIQSQDFSSKISNEHSLENIKTTHLRKTTRISVYGKFLQQQTIQKLQNLP